MDLKQLKELAYKHLGNRKAHQEREKGFIYYHGQRVAKIAVSLREIIFPEENTKDDILIAAAYFHDIAKGIEPHSQYGAVLVKEVLREVCEPQETEEISQLIRFHQSRDSKSNQPKLAKILQDADILDHFGTIEIWMNFQYCAFTESPVQEAVSFYQGEYQRHVDHIGSFLNFEVSKKIFNEKVSFVKQFADRLAIEAAGDIYRLDI